VVTIGVAISVQKWRIARYKGLDVLANPQLITVVDEFPAVRSLEG